VQECTGIPTQHHYCASMLVRRVGTIVSRGDVTAHGGNVSGCDMVMD
jgi:hypothetical protein